VKRKEKTKKMKTEEEAKESKEENKDQDNWMRVKMKRKKANGGSKCNGTQCAPGYTRVYALCPSILKTLSFTVSAWERRPLDNSHATFFPVADHIFLRHLLRKAPTGILHWSVKFLLLAPRQW
jgi:hypothetical protein